MEALDRTLQDIRDDERPFGGVTVVLGGDFLQTLPVVPRGSRMDIVDATIQHSYLWEHVKILSLRQNMRLEQGEDLKNLLNGCWMLVTVATSLTKTQSDFQTICALNHLIH